MASVVHVGSGTKTVLAGTTMTVTPSQAPAAGVGLILVVQIESGTATVSSVTQTNCTWTFAGRFHDSTNGTTLEHWYCVSSGASAGSTLTVTLSTSNLFAVGCYAETDTALASSPVDLTSPTNTGTSTSATSGTSSATAAASEIAVCAIGVDDGGGGGSTTLSSPLSSYNISKQQAATTATASVMNLGLLTKILTTTGTTSSGATIGASQKWSVQLASYKFAVAGGLLAQDYDGVSANTGSQLDGISF